MVIIKLFVLMFVNREQWWGHSRYESYTPRERGRAGVKAVAYRGSDDYVDHSGRRKRCIDDPLRRCQELYHRENSAPTAKWLISSKVFEPYVSTTKTNRGTCVTWHVCQNKVEYSRMPITNATKTMFWAFWFWRKQLSKLTVSTNHGKGLW